MMHIRLLPNPGVRQIPCSLEPNFCFQSVLVSVRTLPQTKGLAFSIRQSIWVEIWPLCSTGEGGHARLWTDRLPLFMFFWPLPETSAMQSNDLACCGTMWHPTSASQHNFCGRPGFHISLLDLLHGNHMIKSLTCCQS